MVKQRWTVATCLAGFVVAYLVAYAEAAALLYWLSCAEDLVNPAFPSWVIICLSVIVQLCGMLAFLCVPGLAVSTGVYVLKLAATVLREHRFSNEAPVTDLSWYRWLVALGVGLPWVLLVGTGLMQTGWDPDYETILECCVFALLQMPSTLVGLRFGKVVATRPLGRRAAATRFCSLAALLLLAGIALTPYGLQGTRLWFQWLGGKF